MCSLGKIDDGGNATASSSDVDGGGLRSYKDLQDLKAQEKLLFNTEFEQVFIL